jgi:hypothetical protein
LATLTRRRFITTSVVGAGFMAGAPAVTKLLAQTQSGCSIASNFNGTPIPGNDYVWFNSVLNVSGRNPQQAVTIGFAPMPIVFTANGTPYIVPMPSALITFTPGLSVATTDFVAGQWVTNVPASGLAGNVFLDGMAFLVPPQGLPGGIHDVTWSGMFFSCTPGLNVQWQWAAAVYQSPSFLDQGLEGLDVKPVDDNKASLYKNSDHAGTPEAFRHAVIGGARGGGGSNFTGSYSGTASCVPMPGSLTGCGAGS